jgi:IS5 family transposase
MRKHLRSGGEPVIEMRQSQLTIAEGFFQERAEEWWEPWMKEADRILEDEDLVELVYVALGQRHPQSATRGRKATPADVVLRLMVLKHVRDWSYETLEREVRANLVYRTFTRLGDEKMPDAKTMGRWGLALGPEVIKRVHERLVQIARQEKVVVGRKLRVDTTVVETNIHYPTDSSLMGDGVRVLTRLMKRAASVVGELGERVRDRLRSVRHRLIEAGRASRGRKPNEEKRKIAYRKLLRTTGQVVAQAKRIEQATEKKRPKNPSKRGRLRAIQQQLKSTIGLVQQVMVQTKARVFDRDIHVKNKVVSLFEPFTEIIRKGKAGKPTEFGSVVQIQEAENQIITYYDTFQQRLSDADLLIPAIETHQKQLGRVPVLIAADAAFYSAANEDAAIQTGVKRISIPNRSTRSPDRRERQRKRWFKKGQKWRTGSEGRISLLKRRHGLDRCRYHGFAGMQRWVGLGVIADNLINIGRVLALQNAK